MKTYQKLTLKGDGGEQLFGRNARSKNPIKRFSSYLYNNHRSSRLYKFLDKVFFTPSKNFEEGIRNLKLWLPTIWKDRHWDRHYIYEVLKRKIELTRNEIIDNNICSDERQNEINRDMTLCLNLIERVQDEYYDHKYYRVVKDKWESKIFGDKEPPFLWDSKEYIKDETERKQYEDEVTAAFEKGHKKHEQAKRILFNIIERKIPIWWD